MQSQLKIILVRPRNPDNIGAPPAHGELSGCRTSPWCSPSLPTGRKPPGLAGRGLVSAIYAMDVINSAKIFDSIPEAVADCRLLLGTSSLHRAIPGATCFSPIRRPISGRAGKTGILFGPEKTGPHQGTPIFCSAMINIPTGRTSLR